MKNSPTYFERSHLKTLSWKTIIVAAVAAAAVPAAAQGQINILHSFYLPTDGFNPGNSLIQSGGVLYGVTYQGPGLGEGTAFSLPIAGGADTILHSFVGGPSDGGYPLGSVALSGSTLYGVTQYGGAQGDGTIFSIPVGGGTSSLVYSFSGGTADGSQPRGSLVVSGTSLYGMTYYGGTNNMGTVFSASTNGGPETVLYSFAGSATGDGQNPSGATGSLILSGSTLYGVTGGGGDRSGDGVVFSVPITGGTDTILHTFNPVGTNDGLNPQGLLLSGTTLFGTTYGGGLGSRYTGDGVLFSLPTSGGAETILHTFAGGTADGSFPNGAPVQIGNTLYGVTSSGGANGDGIIYAINTDGSNYHLVDSFNLATNGSSPTGGLLAIGNTLYGTGGGNGTVFSDTISPVPEPMTLGLLALGGLGLLVRRRALVKV